MSQTEEVRPMSTFQVLVLMLGFGSFIIALLTYIKK
ncbi:putative holin-like toxin [Bacillus amyloliquefaciens]|nr:putative holin-like toxin [Bacillus amyloliquefaciens]UYL12782.1 putative holin-like toxin [Bacillus subtilis]